MQNATPAEAPLPNDGMTADTAPGQDTAQAESVAQEAAAPPAGSERDELPAADVTAGDEAEDEAAGEMSSAAD